MKKIINRAKMFKNFIDYFISNATCSPDKIAIITDSKRVTYQTLNEQSDSIAKILLESGVASEEIVPLIFERCADMIIAMLAVLKAGCAFLPISSLTPCARKKFILEDSKARFVITHNSSLVNVADSNLKIILSHQTKKSEKPVLPLLTENHLAYVMYTSGSTGQPKGVLIEHGSMMNLFSSLISELKLTEKEQVLALTDYTFDISLVELLMPLMLGATIVLTEQGTLGDGFKIKSYLKQHEMTLMQATPITWEILLKQGWKNEGYMKMLVGGEKFSTRLANLLEYGKGNIWNMYGPTETSMWSLFYPLKENIHTDSVPLGEPLAHTIIAILDEHLNEVEMGHEGELYIGGDGLARGYLNNPTLTQEKFIYHPRTHQRLYKTGDRVIAHDNATLCFIGRGDEQLKFGGIRIEAGEIEHIIEQTSLVKKAVVKLHEQTGFYKSLAAYVEIDEAEAFAHEFSVKDADISHYFKKIYDETYQDAENYEQGDINTCGWQSSFTGKLFGAEELKASYRFIAKMINEADLSEVLEIGCGTGSLLLQYINQAKHYTAVEISDKAIEYIKGKLSREQQEKVVFKTQSALDVHECQQYSCVIVNSVIQYFPSIHYLICVLKQLVAATQPNGTVIIGDVRSLELLDVFLLEKSRYQIKSDDQPRLDTFYYKSREAEIILSPKFFYALKQLIPDISHVDIAVKHGSHKNELNYYRYDAILHINKPITYKFPQVINYEKSLDLKAVLKANKDEVIVINKIPNLLTSDSIHKLNEKFPAYVSSLPAKPNTDEIYHGESVNFILNTEIDTHEKLVMYDRSNSLYQLEVHFYPKVAHAKVRYVFAKDCINLRAYCREPFNPWLQKFCFDQIKSKVSQHLVSWVTPSVYIWVEKWPITVNGKLDKKQLQLPIRGTESDKALSATLSNLQKIWESITGDPVVIEKDFSTQGISSLYIHFFLASIHETFSVNISYHESRQYSTLVKLADYIDTLLLRQSSYSTA